MIEYAKKIAWFVIGVTIILAAYLLLRSNVFDNGSGTEAIRSELTAIRKDNQRIISELGAVKQGIADSRKEIGESRTTVVTVRERVEQDGRTLAEAGLIVAESKRITDNIRKRSEGKSP